jgi:hypothetical protein
MKKITFIGICCMVLLIGGLWISGDRWDEAKEIKQTIEYEENIKQEVKTQRVELDPIKPEEVEDFQDFRSQVNLQLEAYK